ncbi:beta-xylosidase [Bifidobacterium lemurum]|uniref:Beta-xylosidase n=1 Tax=Bifidobacterium lemurum TaxID=1603886 RepID=A0A261FSD2_9BIFI|nr:family 43 glycosylhydrolase [Bifidobacterium lemurum]OZG62057.1 beta-xylosidase [Bifidobacterium lemurum]QOL34887.1 family 43 glycosylhydrolase [Bifidobacterium lemurum]
MSEHTSETVGETVSETVSDNVGTAERPAEYPLADGRVAIHDPAIVEENGVYYIFGTHRRFAKSRDLVRWERFDNNLSRDPHALLDEIWSDWPSQPENRELEGNTWAPDVIWNETMRRWCMYMSVNGANFRSVIVLLTAEHLNGDWTYAGPVVYSGFTPDNVRLTDVPRVLGDEASGDLARYQSLKDTRINAIDATPILCEHGEMWMSVGSWFGGVWMFRLDPATGLRDYTTRYPLVKDAADPYYGVKVAGGYWNSGEGSYFVRENGWWYLFMAYGWLGREGGYQIRLFRSKNLVGPYFDQNGNPAISAGEIPNNHTRGTGIRLTSSVKWRGGPACDETVEVAQGHNSVLRRGSDGRLFLVYHTRFIARAEEDYETHIRELLPTPDGWLAAAPYEYQGAPAMAPTARDQLAGEYEIVLHDPHTYFNGKRRGDGSWEGVNLPRAVTLQEDGRVTEGGVVSFHDTSDANLPRETDGPVTCGSWRPLGASGTVAGPTPSETAGSTPSETAHPDACNPQSNTVANIASAASAASRPLRESMWRPSCCRAEMAITVDDVTYTGVFAVLPRETDGRPTLTFTAIGGNQAIWGAKI